MYIRKDLRWGLGIDRGRDRLTHTGLDKVLMQRLCLLQDTFFEIHGDVALHLRLGIQDPMLLDSITNNTFDLVQNLG